MLNDKNRLKKYEHFLLKKFSLYLFWAKLFNDTDFDNTDGTAKLYIHVMLNQTVIVAGY